jgi:hypothetical protein
VSGALRLFFHAMVQRMHGLCSLPPTAFPLTSSRAPSRPSARNAARSGTSPPVSGQHTSEMSPSCLHPKPDQFHLLKPHFW